MDVIGVLYPGKPLVLNYVGLGHVAGFCRFIRALDYGLGHFGCYRGFIPKRSPFSENCPGPHFMYLWPVLIILYS